MLKGREGTAAAAVTTMTMVYRQGTAAVLLICDDYYC